MELSSIAGFRRRVIAARNEFHGIPMAGRGEYGPPDPVTGERWDRSNVLAHMCDLLPFWTGQIRSVLGGATWVGRGDNGYAARRGAIASGPGRAEAELRACIERGIDELLDVLNQLTPVDLEMRIEHRRASETRVRPLEELVDTILVSHLEAHVRQLRELTPGHGPEPSPQQ